MWYPISLYWECGHISDTLNRPDLKVFISENGCAARDELTDQGEVLDMDRIHYLRQYLQSAHRAISQGYPLMGYFPVELSGLILSGTTATEQALRHHLM